MKGDSSTLLLKNRVIVIDRPVLERIDRSALKHGANLQYSVELANGVIRRFDGIDSLLHLRNSGNEKIASIHCESSAGDELALSMKLRPRMNYVVELYIAGNYDRVLLLREELSDILHASGPWYAGIRAISGKLDLLLFMFPFLVIAAIAILATVLPITIDSDNSSDRDMALIYLVLILIGYYVVAYYVIKPIANLLFPEIIFDIGDRSGQYGNLRMIHITILSAIFLPIIFALVL